MKSPGDIPRFAWKLALAACACVWGGSFVVLKGALDIITPGWLLALRFSATTAIMALVLRRPLAEHLSARVLAQGALLGLLSGAGYLVQNVGLTGTTPARNAFLTSIYCVLVPFIDWAVARRRPRRANVLAALMCIGGVGLLSLRGGFSLALGAGDGLSLLSAALYALHIVAVARFSERSDIYALTVVQLATTALLCAAFALAFEPMPDPAVLAEPRVIAAFAYLILFASCFAMVVQNVAQTRVEPAQAALILSLESVFAVAASVIFCNETITLRTAAGFALIFCAVLVSELAPQLHDKIAARDLI